MKSENKNAFQRLGKAIKSILNKLENALAIYKKHTPDSLDLLDLEKGAYEKLQDLYLKAFVEAEKNYTPAEDSEVKFSLRGVDENGVEIYETSKSTKDLTNNQKKKFLLEIIRNDYVGKTVKFHKNGEVYYAFLNKTSANKAIYGDKKSDSSGYRAKLNIGADGNYIELLENSKYNKSSDEQGKQTNTDIHNNTTSWDYYVKTVSSDGVLFDVLINIANKGDNQYVYDVNLKKQKKQHPTSDSYNGYLNQGDVVKADVLAVESQKAKENSDNISTNNNISQKNTAVNNIVRKKSKNNTEKLSERFPDYYTSLKDLTDIFRETYDVSMKKNEMYDRFNELVSVIDSENLVEDSTEYSAIQKQKKELLQSIADDIAYNQKPETDELVVNIKSYLRNTGIKVSETDKTDIGKGYDGWNNFRKSQMGKLKFTKDGMPVDEVYAGLTEMFGERYFPTDVWNTSV